MFKLVDNPTFTREVTVFVPSDGGHDKHKFRATFKVLGTNEADRFDLNDEKGAREFLACILVGLDDIADENGEALPYSDQLRDRVLSLPYARVALAKAYFDNVSKIRAGN